MAEYVAYPMHSKSLISRSIPILLSPRNKRNRAQLCPRRGAPGFVVPDRWCAVCPKSHIPQTETRRSEEFGGGNINATTATFDSSKVDFIPSDRDLQGI
jgi:hypothetical protein